MANQGQVPARCIQLHFAAYKICWDVHSHGGCWCLCVPGSAVGSAARQLWEACCASSVAG